MVITASANLPYLHLSKCDDLILVWNESVNSIGLKKILSEIMQCKTYNCWFNDLVILKTQSTAHERRRTYTSKPPVASR